MLFPDRSVVGSHAGAVVGVTAGIDLVDQITDSRSMGLCRAENDGLLLLVDVLHQDLDTFFFSRFDLDDTVEIRLPLTDVQMEELNLPMGFMADAFNAPVVQFTAHVGSRAHTWTGRIVRTHASVDQQTRLIYAIAEVEDPYGLGSDSGAPLAVGMFVNANIAGANSQLALVLPRLALRSANKVYVINDENRLEIRTVEVISTSKDTVLVSTGVKVGDKVVTSTIPAAVDGMEVRAITREQQS